MRSSGNIKSRLGRRASSFTSPSREAPFPSNDRTNYWSGGSGFAFFFHVFEAGAQAVPALVLRAQVSFGAFLCEFDAHGAGLGLLFHFLRRYSTVFGRIPEAGAKTSRI